MKMVNVGFSSYVSKDKVTAIVSIESAPVKRMVRNAEDKNMLIDATFGKKTKSIIVTSDNHLIASSVLPESLMGRMEKEEE